MRQLGDTTIVELSSEGLRTAPNVPESAVRCSGLDSLFSLSRRCSAEPSHFFASRLACDCQVLKKRVGLHCSNSHFSQLRREVGHPISFFFRRLRAGGEFVVAAGFGDAVLADLVEKGFVADLQDCCCLLTVPVCLLESLGYGDGFGFVLGGTCQ